VLRQCYVFLRLYPPRKQRFHLWLLDKRFSEPGASPRITGLRGCNAATVASTISFHVTVPGTSAQFPSMVTRTSSRSGEPGRSYHAEKKSQRLVELRLDSHGCRWLTKTTQLTLTAHSGSGSTRAHANGGATLNSPLQPRRFKVRRCCYINLTSAAPAQQ
jgi:hypothetical protein